MAFGKTTKKETTTKKKSSTAVDLKRENSALKNEVESLKQQIAETAKRFEASAPAPAAANDDDIAKQLDQFKAVIRTLCSHHPGFNDHIRAAGLKTLL